MTATLSDTSRVVLQQLHVGEPDRGEHEVGRAETGTFVSLPPEGVELLTLLGSGSPLAEVKEVFAQRHGEPPALEDFVRALVSCGFVRTIDGVAPGGQLEPTTRGWRLLADIPESRVAWLLSRPMKAAYLTVWVAVPLLLLLRPSMIPTSSDALVHTRVVVNSLVLFALGWGLVLAHELAHLLAARAIGCASSLTVSHRLHFVVAQTDMTSVRTQPRRRRYGPYLAGITWDLVVLVACLTAELAGLANALTKAAVYLIVVNLIFELAFFMRTDTYFVFANWLHLGNLMEDTRHWLSNSLHRLVRRPAPHDLTAVPERELRIIRWYGAFCVLGVGIVLADFAFLGLPVLISFSSDAWHGLAQGPGRGAFWDGATFISLTVLNFGLLAYVIGRARGERRRAGPAR